MSEAGVQGLAEAYSLIDRLPTTAHDELGVEMAIIGREILAAQRADAPKDTGALEAGLSLQLLLDRLKVRIGLLKGGRAAYRFNGRARKALSGGPFYGRFVEFGRKAQTVLVTRRLKLRTLKGNNRNGNRRRTLFHDGKPYPMKVKAMAPRPYILQPLFEEVAEQHLADYWTRTIARAGGGS